MGFLQIISFGTDRFDEFVALEHAWSEGTVGRRTGVGAQVFADRDRPGHYVALEWFDSYESAMVNSQLPETDAFARRAGELATDGPVFGNLEPVSAPWNAGEVELRATLETSSATPHTFADDVDLDLVVPHGRMRSSGIAALEESLRAEAPGRDIEVWNRRRSRRLRRRVRLPHARHALPGRGPDAGHPPRRAGRAAGHHVRRQLVGRDRGRRGRRERCARPAGDRGRPVTAVDEVTGQVTGRLFESLLGALEVVTVHLGCGSACTPPWSRPTGRRARGRAGIDQRYAREWLEQQAIAGLVAVVAPGDAHTRVYGLGDGQRRASPTPIPRVRRPVALLFGGVHEVRRLPDVFRNGSGIPFGAYGDEVRLGQGMFNRAGYLDQLAGVGPFDARVAGLLSRPSSRAGPGLRRRLVLDRARAGVPRAERPGGRQRRRVGDGRPGERRGRRSRRPGAFRGRRRRRALGPGRATSRSTSRPCTTWPTRWSPWPPYIRRCDQMVWSW